MCLGSSFRFYPATICINKRPKQRKNGVAGCRRRGKLTAGKPASRIRKGDRHPKRDKHLISPSVARAFSAFLLGGGTFQAQADGFLRYVPPDCPALVICPPLPIRIRHRYRPAALGTSLLIRKRVCHIHSGGTDCRCNALPKASEQAMQRTQPLSLWPGTRRLRNSEPAPPSRTVVQCPRDGRDRQEMFPRRP